MAKTSKIEMNKRRKKMAAQYDERRKALKATMKDPKSTFEQRLEAMLKLQAIPRNANPVRYRNRCEISGRPRGFYRDFKMSRIALRDHGLAGEIPGLTKSSW